MSQSSRNHTTVASWAREYLRRGWRPIPIPRGEKSPTRKNWQKLNLKESDLAASFPDNSNIGILVGEPSGLVDVDLDAREALALADEFLPASQLVHGRPSKPRSHRWYESNSIPQAAKFADLDGQCLLELRSTGQQTIVCPSIHPSGEQIKWDPFGAPTRIQRELLLEAVRRVAAAALGARHWAKPGNRHEASLALAGFLLRGGFDLEQGLHFVGAVARAAGDEEFRARQDDVRTTLRRLAADQSATGRTRLSDLLGQTVVQRLAQWLGIRLETPASPYHIRDGHFIYERVSRDGSLAVVPLCNFTASISEEVVVDDGAEATRHFVLGGQLDSGEPLSKIRIPASRFGGMSWVNPAWGARARVGAGSSTADRVRDAIQIHSTSLKERKLYTHTGWRSIEGRWVFLTARSAVGGEGLDLQVELPADLQRYALPATPLDVRNAMQLSVALLDVGPLVLTAPLWAAVFRAPLSELVPVDFSLWLEGRTGQLKSTLAALFLAHYGAFTRTALPGSWLCTPNSLEHAAHVLKDALYVIDDFAPSAATARPLEAAAARILRAQGNVAGRGRLRSDLTSRPQYPPRGLILASGEVPPVGESVRARTLLLTAERSSIDLDRLGAAQRASDRLPHALAGYLIWLAPQIDQLRSTLPASLEEFRAHVVGVGQHLRIPEVVANLWLGLDIALCFAEHVGACSEIEGKQRREACGGALLDAAQVQAARVASEQPAVRFLRILGALILQRRAVLLPKELPPDGNIAELPFVGWIEGDSIFLQPEAAFREVGRFAREAGEAATFSQDAVLRDLRAIGISNCDSGRLTTTHWLGGQTRRVVVLSLAKVKRVTGEDFPVRQNTSRIREE